MISGVAILDSNRDGRKDIAFPTALFRDDGNNKFTYVTTMAGIEAKVLGTAITTADYDNDGLPDP